MAMPKTMQEVKKGWQASLKLRFEGRANKTVLAENSHHGPLRVQRTFYPEDTVCHAYILHPPGGVVGGDELQIDVGVTHGGHALVTTPGATKFYRSPKKTAFQRQRLRVEGGILEWFPQDNIVFPGGRAQLNTEIHLDSEATFIGWEILCLGLPSKKEEFDSGELNSRLSISRNGSPLFLDNLKVTGKHDIHSVIGLRGYSVTATMLVTGFLQTGENREKIDNFRGLLQNNTECLTGITTMGELMVARYLGHSTFEARDIFQRLWEKLRPEIMGRKACPPRIWNT